VSTATVDQPAASEIQLAKVMQALADDSRLAIVREIAANGEMPCGSLELPISKATKSHHLKVLREAGITETRTEGTRHFVTLRSVDLDARFPGLLNAIRTAS
jgi:DNA-binding transcriptional ArsR family regulator